MAIVRTCVLPRAMTARPDRENDCLVGDRPSILRPAGRQDRGARVQHAVILGLAQGACVLGAALLAACAVPSSRSTVDAPSVDAAHHGAVGSHATASSAYVPPPAVQSGAVPAEDVLSPIASVFPLDRYDQNIDRWIDPASPSYAVPLLSPPAQGQAMQALLALYFGPSAAAPRGTVRPTASTSTQSPWDPAFVADALSPLGRIALAARIEAKLREFAPDGPRRGFGPNLRPHPATWIAAIRENIDTPHFLRAPIADGGTPNKHGTRKHAEPATRDRAEAEAEDNDKDKAIALQGRAIAIRQAFVRLLPTDDPFFYDPRLPGEGYPFDNLQESTIAPGTPLYVVGSTRDGAWDYVLSPGLSGWVRHEALASVDEGFVRRWRQAAYARLLAVTGRDATLRDTHGQYRFDAPIGTVLPAGPAPDTVLAPVIDAQRRALIVIAQAPQGIWQAMPLSPTPQNMAMLLKALQGRPYGWGGTGFYNDCSLELHDLMMPFGLVLPRHSSFQVEGPAMVDLSDRNEKDRLDYLMAHGRPFFTIIHIPGHVMLYIGNGIVEGRQVPLVYEDMWGLSPSDRSRRAIVGQSAVMPLLSAFAEDPALQGQAAGKIFRLGFHAQGLPPLSLTPDDTSADTASGAGMATVTPDTPAEAH